MNTRNRVALAAIIPAAVAYVLLARHAAHVDSLREWDDILLPVTLVSLAVGWLGGVALSGPGVTAAYPLGDRHRFATAAWRVIARGWWGLVAAALAAAAPAFAATGVAAALATTAGLTGAGFGLVRASRLRRWAQVCALAAGSFLVAAALFLAPVVFDHVEADISERSSIARIQAHLDAARDYIADGHRLYTFDFAETPDSYLIAEHLLRAGGPERFMVGGTDPRPDGTFVFISHRDTFEKDLRDNCPLVKPAARTMPTGRAVCWAIEGHDAVAQVTATGLLGTTRVVVEFVEDDQPVRLLMLDEHHHTPEEITGYVGDVLDSLVPYDPDRWTAQEINAFFAGDLE